MTIASNADKRHQTWDIFCQVIDNFGDIGTTWRLAQQLHKEHGYTVRLWVDELQALQALVPETNISLAQQWIEHIEVCHWTSTFATEITPAQVVIEAFACPLPDNYLVAMQQQDSSPIWLNLEYFSCESWVAGCHGLPSLQNNGLKKWFFFPGITPQSGGLLREKHLIQQRNHFVSDDILQTSWLTRHQLPKARPHSLKISLFAYENAAIGQLLTYLSSTEYCIDAYLPAGKLLNSVKQQLNIPQLTAGQTLHLNNLHLHIIPFMPQADFDQLLWYCDINFVRGEESLTRAIWAGKPFIWHIYPTDDLAHWPKLNAFIESYHMPSILADLTREWNHQHLNLTTLDSTLQQINEINDYCHRRSEQISQQPGLCQQLIEFVEQQAKML